MHSHLGQRRTTVSRPLGSAELIFRPRRSNGGRPAVLQERNATMRYARIEGIGIIPYWEFNKLAPPAHAPVRRQGPRLQPLQRRLDVLC